MPRAPRVQVAGGVYHVISRGNRRHTVFHDDTDYASFIKFLGIVVRRYGWRCHGYCLMPNHFHLLIETPEPNISEGMQRLNSRYAQWFNRRYGYTGHLFQGRFYGRLVESTYHLLELARYVVANPVRAGLCSHAGELEMEQLSSRDRRGRACDFPYGWLAVESVRPGPEAGARDVPAVRPRSACETTCAVTRSALSRGLTPGDGWISRSRRRPGNALPAAARAGPSAGRRR